MTEQNNHQTDPTALAKLIDTDAGQVGDTVWGTNDIASVLVHQLNAPLAVDLVEYDPTIPDRLETLSSKGHQLKTFRDLFESPNPPAVLLEACKSFAKAQQASPDAALPKDVAILLYYMAIAASLSRCNQRITQLPDKEIRRGLDWALKLNWLDSASRALVTACRDDLFPSN